MGFHPDDPGFFEGCGHGCRVGRPDGHEVPAKAVLEVFRGVDGDDLSVIDDGDPVAQPVRFFHVMRREDDRDPFLLRERGDVVPEVVAGLGVKAERGFIEEEDRRVVEKAAGDLKAPPHPAGEGLDNIISPVVQFDQREELGDPLLPDLCRDPVEPAMEVHVLPCGQFLVKALVLEDDADGFPHPVRVLFDIDAIDRC